MSAARLLAAVVLAAGIMLSPRAEEKKKPPAPQKATAEQLLDDAEKAIAFIAKEIHDSKDKSLDLKSVRQQPFFSALKKTEDITVKIKSQLKDHDLKFFNSVNDSTQLVAELKSALPRSGIKNAKVADGVKVISNALTLLRRNYGRESAHRRQNTGMTEKEKEQLTALRESESKLIDELDALTDEFKTNAQLTAELQRLISQLKKSLDAPMTAQSLDAALELVDVVEGEWEAYSYYVDAKHRKAWQEARDSDAFQDVDDLAAEAEESGDALDWLAMDDSVELSGAVNLNVDLNEDEQAAYLRYIQESLNGVDLDEFYAATMDPDESDEAFQEFQDDEEMQAQQQQQPQQQCP
ncbi:MAG TPA: hypothetical protein VKX17_21645 [Planctomycetota bacterium]|nr:hypothetical protein [Planctomycetota bacterium]